MYSPRTGGRYNGAQPSKRAVASIKDSIRQRLRPGNQAPWEEVARDLNRTCGMVRLLFLWFGGEARHDVGTSSYHTVRCFLRRRHKVAGPGYRQFPMQDVFGPLGVLSPESCTRFVLRIP